MEFFNTEICVAATGEVVSHWETLIWDFHLSTLEFYQQVEQVLIAQNLPDVRIERVTHREGGITSASREYLRVRKGKFAFDVCGAHYGNSQFFSWWLVELRPQYAAAIGCGALIVIPMLIAALMSAVGVIRGLFMGVIGMTVLGWLIRNGLKEGMEGIEDIVLAIPYVGPIYKAVFQPETYYKVDSRQMFMLIVEEIVKTAIRNMTSAQGQRALEPIDFRPTMVDLMK